MRIGVLLPSWEEFLEETAGLFKFRGLSRADWLDGGKRAQMLRFIARRWGPEAMHYAAVRLQGVMFDNSGTYHYRVGSPMKWLEREGGHETQRVSGLDEGEPDRFDVIVIPRAQSLALARLVEEARAAGRRARFVYECDDWVFSVPPSNPARYAIDPAGAAAAARAADAITVTTEALALRFRRAFPGKPVFVLPNCVDFEAWPPLEEGEFRPETRNGEKVRIAWAGSATHNNDFREAGRALWELKGRRGLLGRKAEFAVLGDAPPDIVKSFCHAPYGFALPRVNLDRYWGVFAALAPDVCIAPLNAVSQPDREFNLCKSNIKYLEAAASGACTVATAIETYSAPPCDGCLHCDDAAQWAETLSRLIEDDDLRLELRRKALECVRANWSMAARWRLWEEAYERIVSCGAKSGDGERAEAAAEVHGGRR